LEVKISAYLREIEAHEAYIVFACRWFTGSMQRAISGERQDNKKRVHSYSRV
jgi:hypothetical protein